MDEKVVFDFRDLLSKQDEVCCFVWMPCELQRFEEYEIIYLRKPCRESIDCFFEIDGLYSPKVSTNLLDIYAFSSSSFYSFYR